uniref:Ig-like domain-containing protein n=1 Tax=Periophthalmus magnuspinnatus TaxID=409849 RepID=A0A3B4BI55_9GOBI
ALTSGLILRCCFSTFGCIYPRDLTVSVPNLEALNGSCLLIPCTFSIPNQHEDKIDLSKPVVAIWSDVVPNIGRPADPVFFHSDMTSLTSPMEMIGDLQQKNCTMLFSDINTNHSDDYFLRIENYKYKATAGCNPLKINVQGKTLLGLKHEYQETVTITCSAPSPCPHSPPELTWSFQPELPHNMLQSFPTSVQHMVQNSDGTFHTSVQLQMRLSENYHGLEVRCSAVYPVKEGHKTAHGNITVRIERKCAASLKSFRKVYHNSVDLRCSCRAWPPVQSFTWFRVTSQGPQRVYEGQVYSLIFNHTTQGEYFCQAQNQVGKQNSSTIKLQPEVY